MALKDNKNDKSDKTDDSDELSVDSMSGDNWLDTLKKRNADLSSSSNDNPTNSAHKSPNHNNEGRRRSYALTGGGKQSPAKKIEKRPTAGRSFSFFNKKKTKLIDDDVSNDNKESSDAEVTYQGWLYKKGTLRHNWKKRYFVLQGNLLKYYANEKLDKAKGILNLTGGKVEAGESRTLMEFILFSGD